MKRSVQLLFLIILSVFMMIACDSGLTGAEVEGLNESRAAAGETRTVRGIFTFYWTFDPTCQEEIEAIAKDGYAPCRCTSAVNDRDGNPIPGVRVNTGLLPRYVMEGSGFVWVNGQRRVLNLVDKGSYYGDAHDSRFNSTFKLVPLEFPWGEAYYDHNENGQDDDGEITGLDPFVTCAVTTNIVGGSTVHVYAMDGYSYIDPDTGSSRTHDGNFTALDSSWSFAVEDLPAGYEAWVDLYVGGYNNYKDAEKHIWDSWVENEQTEFNVEEIGVWVKVLNGVDQGATWFRAEFKNAARADEWTAHGGYYQVGDYVTYAGNTYKCTYPAPAYAGYEPNQSYMWSSWELQ